MKKNQAEIISSCCAFGSDGTEDVYVKIDDCPMKREMGQRIRNQYIAVPQGTVNPEITECACIQFSGLHGIHRIPPCSHYQGAKKVTRDKRKCYLVQCSALQKEDSSV